MPSRKTPLVSGEIYHLLNRGVEHRPIFSSQRDYRRFLKTINFYRFSSSLVRLSQYLEFSKERKTKFLEESKKSKKQLVKIFCFCLMPNHFHFLVEQLEENGISDFLRLVQNSYAKYFNFRNERAGPLFQGEFKAIRVETEEQLVHLSRYIHLNPYSSFVVKKLKDLKKYPWSSFLDYLMPSGGNQNFLVKKPILDLFKETKGYQEFVFNQADYQRELEKIKHLTWPE